MKTYPVSLMVTAALVVLTAACTKAPNVADDEAAIRRTDAAMVAALNARDLEGWLRHLATDAKLLPPGAPAVEGHDAIRGLAGPMLKMPEFAVAHRLQSVNVSRGGDLAWVSYAFELTVQDAAGRAVTEKGKDITIYRKEADGSWKVVIDMWSENQSSI